MTNGTFLARGGTPAVMPLPDDVDFEHRRLQLRRLVSDLESDRRAQGQPSTREAIAEELGYVPAHLSRMEHGKRRVADMAIEKMAGRIRLDPAYFDDKSGRGYKDFPLKDSPTRAKYGSHGSFGRALELAVEITMVANDREAVRPLVEPLIKELLSMPAIADAQRADEETDPERKITAVWGIAWRVREMVERDPKAIEQLRRLLPRK
jgi:transcriptional regulator with XRE-family HTH domain